MREPLSEAHIRSHVPGEEGDSWFCVRMGPMLCEFVYSPFFSMVLKGWFSSWQRNRRLHCVCL